MKTIYGDNIKYFDIKIGKIDEQWCQILAREIYASGLVSVDPIIGITAGVSLAFKRGRYINLKRLRRFCLLGCWLMISIGQIIGYIYAHYGF